MFTASPRWIRLFHRIVRPSVVLFTSGNSCSDSATARRTKSLNDGAAPFFFSSARRAPRSVMSTETVTKKWGAVVTLEVSRWAITWRMRLMNASRSAGGLVPLTLDPVVSAAARAHSAVEAQYRYVYHDGPDGTAKSRYVPVCGTGWYGENTGKVWNDNVDVLHVEFMNEPWEPINHRTNIMDPLFRRVGIGAVVGPDALYMTMAFCR